MNTKLITLLLAAGMVGNMPVFAAAPGPESNFDKNAVWAHPNITGVDATGLSTRGVLYFDMSNDVGTVDRLTEALSTASETNTLSDGEIAELQQILAVASVLSTSHDGVQKVKSWLETNLASPHRADMALLLADLMLEQGLYGEANEAYRKIDINTLSPNLRADYLYHLAYSDLRLANYVRASAEFDNPELLESKEYGNASRFYSGYISYVDRDYNNALRAWDNINSTSMPGRMADYYRAQIAYYNGNYNEALRLARPLLGDTNVNPLFTAEANRIVGESYFQNGEAAQAISYLKKYVSAVETPERSAQYILGLACYDDGDYAGAVEYLTPVTTDESPMGQSAYLYIGQAKLKLGDNNAAMMAFNRALDTNFNPEITEVAYYNYAVAKSRGANVPFASSVNIFEEFLSRYPNSRFAEDVEGYIVNGYLTDGNYEAALKSINRIKQPSSKILGAKQKVLYMLGAKYLANDRPQEAVDMLSQAKSLARYDAETATETNLVLGEALYRAGRYNESAEALLDYLDEVPASNPNHAVALYDLGYTRMALEEWAKAEINFERLLANPGNLTNATKSDAATRLGDARYYQRDWKGAASAYNTAYDMYPHDGDYPLFQQAIMQGYSREYNNKLNTLNQLLKAFPSSALVPDALMEKADTYVQLKQPEKATEIYNELIDKYSETSQGRRAYLFLASGMASNGNIDGAIETYQKLITLASTSEEARQANEAVKRLHALRGTLDEYSDFVENIEGASSLNSEEAETLTWNAAEHAYLSGNGVALLERYVREYPSGHYTARALSYLLDQSEEDGDDDRSYHWASMLVSQFPNNAATEYALIVKGDIDYFNGRGMDALKSWETLEQKASTPENKNIARLGIMRVARDMGDAERMRTTAEQLLQSSTIGAEEKTEAAFSRALAMSLDGETDGAIAAWKELAGNTDDLYGAKAAVYAIEALNGQQKFDEAGKMAETFIGSGTPHTYWLARGFIALSDAYAGQGREFEAREYLKALNENYPGDETDIFDMIEERLY